MKWDHQTPEYADGDYYFSGRIYMTHAVSSSVPEDEINEIIHHIKNMVNDSIKTNNKGIDYLQVFALGDQKIFVIDQMAKYQLDDLQEPQKSDYNYFTILFSYEY